MAPWCSSCGAPLGGIGGAAHKDQVQSPERLHWAQIEPNDTGSRYGLKTVGGAVLLFGIVFGLYALNMDTSVQTGFGRINNIGLLNDQHNYIIVAGIAVLAGVFTMAVAWRQTTPRPSETTLLNVDPFDALDAEKANARKHYAISLGVTRENGKFIFDDARYEDVETAIAAAEARVALS